MEGLGTGIQDSLGGERAASRASRRLRRSQQRRLALYIAARRAASGGVTVSQLPAEADRGGKEGVDIAALCPVIEEAGADGDTAIDDGARWRNDAARNPSYRQASERRMLGFAPPGYG
jgi:hypothetical protein